MPSMSEQPGVRATSTRYQLGQAVRELLRLAPTVHAELAHRLDIGITDLRALDQATSNQAPLGVVELGDRLGMRSASATVLVDRLVATGHLDRQPHPTDRRRITLHPTQSAHDEVGSALAPLIRDIGAAAESFDDATADATLQFLTAVIAALEDFIAQPDPPADDAHSIPLGRASGR